jgi:hypothetical protein
MIAMNSKVKKNKLKYNKNTVKEAQLNKKLEQQMQEINGEGITTL